MDRRSDCCHTADLIAYRDGTHAPDELARVEAHVASCAACSAEVERLSARAMLLTKGLGLLDPVASEMPQPAAAADRLESTVANRLEPDSQPSRRSEAMNVLGVIQRAWRPIAVVGLVLVLVAAMLSLAPVRQAAAQFLSVFRVQQITVVPIDSNQTAKLEELAMFLDSASMAEPEMLREPTEPQLVADVAEAAAVAGFAVREIRDLTDGTSLTSMDAAVGPHLRFDIDRPTMELVLAAAGVTDVSWPPNDSIVIEVDVPSIVQQTYAVDGEELSAMQMPSPTVTFPPGLPMDQLGAAYLRLLGLDADAADSMAREIDWTSTLVMPIPTDAVSYEEVSVDGATGILVHDEWQPDRPQTYHLMWQDDGMMFSMSGQGVTASLLMRAAEALQ